MELQNQLSIDLRMYYVRLQSIPPFISTAKYTCKQIINIYRFLILVFFFFLFIYIFAFLLWLAISCTEKQLETAVCSIFIYLSFVVSFCCYSIQQKCFWYFVLRDLWLVCIKLFLKKRGNNTFLELICFATTNRQ